MPDWIWIVPPICCGAGGFLFGRAWSIAELLDLRSEHEILVAKYKSMTTRQRGANGRFTRHK